MKKYVCEPCGYVYDPEVGDPDGGIAPGTAFEDIPDDWVCPVCGMGKDAFAEEQAQPILLFFLAWVFGCAVFLRCAGTGLAKIHTKAEGGPE